ncbi:Histone H1 [Acipenser ruthenus]|uniref:Histone H1 n=1 Tax=Acipenser ruthenus TaxID=7906 RepID=A0A662YT88_ACIRT|nr:histone H1-like [Acipenser ruthenus]RXM99081.1 Histone H1 [Acipenser ruthenus]
MAEVAPVAPTEAAPAPVKAVKAGKKKTATKPKKAGPSVSDLIVKAVSASKERSGVSLAALKKALAAGGYDVEKNNSRVNTAVKSLVSKETLLQTKGVGASGSFRLNKKVAEAKDKVAKKKAVPKPKKPAVKKAAPKKAPAKKPATKKPATKSPKKAKKPAAKKAATKSPKKAKKPAAKKPTKSPKKVAKPQAAKTKRAAPKRR